MAGPSIIACYIVEKRTPGVEMRARLTLLWSMISAMTATLPAWGPDRRRTTEKKKHNFRYLKDPVQGYVPRPTSTNRLKFDSDWKERFEASQSIVSLMSSKAGQRNPSEIHVSL